MSQCQPPAAALDPADPARVGLDRAADGPMWLDRRFRRRLDTAGLGCFEAVMGTTEGECLRALEDRENWRLELDAPDGSRGAFYLKKHHVRTWRSLLWAAVGSEPDDSAGRTEARNVGRLGAKGIGVMRLVAYGERLRGNGRLESFVLTEELAGFEPLDDFLRRRFRPRAGGSRGGEDRDLARLVRTVANVAREFHAAGFNHRDFYCCHFFVREQSPGEFEIRLIDLQRVEHRRRFRRRWLVKDLAQLAYSAPRDRIGCSLKLAFLRHYFGVSKLEAREKRLIRRVLGKQKLMEWKRGIIA